MASFCLLFISSPLAVSVRMLAWPFQGIILYQESSLFGMVKMRLWKSSVLIKLMQSMWCASLSLGEKQT